MYVLDPDVSWPRRPYVDLCAEAADVGVVEVGGGTSGAGGQIDGLVEVQRFVETLGLGDAAMTCQPEDADPALTVLDPSGP